MLIGVAVRFNPPPGWPPPPPGFTPDPGWRPDPSWPPVPPGWQMWVADDQDTAASGGSAGGWSAAPPSGTSGLAIAAFVLGLLGIAGISAIAAIVLGIVAVHQIRRTRQEGKGLAIAGIVLGGCWLALPLIVGLVALPALTLNPATPGPPFVSPTTLSVGACFVDPTPQSVTPSQAQRPMSVLRTPCNVPHNGQIFGKFTVSGSSLNYPGSAKLLSLASSGCTARAQTSLDRTKAADAMKIQFLYPPASSWRAGQRTVSCLIVTPAPTLTSSLVKS